VIDGLSKKGDTSKVEQLRVEMIIKGLIPDVVTYSSLMGDLCRQHGKRKGSSLKGQRFAPFPAAFSGIVPL